MQQLVRKYPIWLAFLALILRWVQIAPQEAMQIAKVRGSLKAGAGNTRRQQELAGTSLPARRWGRRCTLWPGTRNAGSILI